MNTLLRYHPTTTVAFTLNQYNPQSATTATKSQCLRTDQGSFDAS